ncbi:hypothetical protein OEIGOIKO_05818 [Streptomyces chrestomyceticus JCM 4735]|uniref:DNA-binding phage zinc finger domain-containing protein n=1 Tax=Streptomyces chrestomyceticus JCM 4735 TaxID=1306181 RepID=A0A7U9L073_9ACTN|nr:hypothetical protein [Streptomyces chrestomyceticus]GCD38008.1 hypothetical protein OEIGOIKO_05818 [Streptomyces chrestomyceticus JCM 4735]
MIRRIPGAPMPETIRHYLRARQHPARAVECPHCGAHPHRPCTTISGRRLLPEPHPQRVSAWVRAIACCPACQVEPGVPCHLDGRPLRNGEVHPQRAAEAAVTPA